MDMPRFPHFRQLEAMDCGPACLKMICMFHKKDFSIKEIRKRSSFTTQGVTMLDLCLAADYIGFSTLSVTLTIDQFINKAILPCIVHYYNHHFIVVYRISVKKGKTFIHVADPANQLKIYTLEEFQKGWLTNYQNGVQKGKSLMLELK